MVVDAIIAVQHPAGEVRDIILFVDIIFFVEEERWVELFFFIVCYKGGVLLNPRRAGSELLDFFRRHSFKFLVKIYSPSGISYHLIPGRLHLQRMHVDETVEFVLPVTWIHLALKLWLYYIKNQFKRFMFNLFWLINFATFIQIRRNSKYLFLSIAADRSCRCLFLFSAFGCLCPQLDIFPHCPEDSSIRQEGMFICMILCLYFCLSERLAFSFSALSIISPLGFLFISFFRWEIDQLFIWPSFVWKSDRFMLKLLRGMILSFLVLGLSDGWLRTWIIHSCPSCFILGCELLCWSPLFLPRIATSYPKNYFSSFSLPKPISTFWTPPHDWSLPLAFLFHLSSQFCQQTSSN